MAAQQALTSATLVIRSDQLVDAEVDGEVVALHVEKGNCYGMNKVASRVWNLTASPKSVSAICEALLEEFEVSPDQCEKQVLQLLEELRAEGMIEILDSKAPAVGG